MISNTYRKQLEELHKKNEDWGTGPKGNIIRICNWIYENDIRDILDYGCGKGENLPMFLPIRVRNYDPAVPKWSKDPKPIGYVLCTDVLEHVEPEYIESVLKHMVSKFSKKAFVTISMKEARETLPDGRNAHLIVKPADWWINLIKKYAFIESIDFARDNPKQNDLVLVLRRKVVINSI